MRELFASRELVFSLTIREIRIKYRRTVIGQAWSLLNPIAQITIYSVVFSFVLRVDPPASASTGIDVFGLWLSAALLPYLFFSTVVSSGTTTLVSNANLITKVYFPREALVAAAVLAALFSFVIELTVLHGAVLVFGGTVRIELVALTIVLVALLALFAGGIVLAVSAINVYFRDLQHLVGLLMQVWFYATPIFYPLKIVVSRLGENSTALFVYELNPMERFGEAFRDTIYDATLPPMSTLAYLCGVTIASVMIGHLIFRRLEGRLAEEL